MTPKKKATTKKKAPPLGFTEDGSRDETTVGLVRVNPNSTIRVWDEMSHGDVGGIGSSALGHHFAGQPIEEVKADGNGFAVLTKHYGWIEYELGAWPAWLPPECPHCGRGTVPNHPKPVLAVRIMGADGPIALDPYPGVGDLVGVAQSMPASAGKPA
jgi:hypothetical protein